MKSDAIRPNSHLRIPAPPLNRNAFHIWWSAESGYREVVRLAWPLFLAQGSTTILQFIDRVFLTWYSPVGMASAGPAGMLAFTMQALFIGLAGYSSVFVAQYTGAGKPRQAISIVWQALYLAVIASMLLMLCIPLGGELFHLAGHTLQMQRYERAFFRIFLFGSIVIVSNAAISGYFIGRGITRIILWINLVGVATNIILDYLLIFGNAGFPRMGVSGAALSSVLSQCVGFIIAFTLFLRESSFHIGDVWKPNKALILRLLRYGSANGIQFALDMSGWTIFLLMVGHLGVNALAASNIAFQVNTFAFFPIIGIAMSASTLVGQNLGRNRPDLADKAVWSAIHIGICFTGMIALLYLFFPGLFIAPFGAEANPVAFAPVRSLTLVLLRFVVCYCLFDVGNLVFSAALKGAGDTLFVMFLSSSISICLMLTPTLLWCIQPGGLGVFGAWSFLTLTVLALSISFLLRYLHGGWSGMRMIEHEHEIV